MRHDSISWFSPSLHTYLLVLFKQFCQFIRSIPDQELFSRLKDVSTSCFLEITFSNAYGPSVGRQVDAVVYTITFRFSGIMLFDTFSMPAC